MFTLIEGDVCSLREVTEVEYAWISVYISSYNVLFPYLKWVNHLDDVKFECVFYTVKAN